MPARRAFGPSTLLVLPLLAGCGLGEFDADALVGRTPVDLLVSMAAARDCSLVRLDRGEGYCAPAEAPPAPPPFCTRSLGRVDCWTVPPHAYPPYRGAADGPHALTAAQEAHRARWGPGLSGLLAGDGP